jgi:hypothetical protein
MQVSPFNIAAQVRAARAMARAAFLNAYVPSLESARSFQADFEAVELAATLQVWRDSFTLARAEAIVQGREFSTLK